MGSSPGSSDDIGPLQLMENGRKVPINVPQTRINSSYTHNPRASNRNSTQTNLKQRENVLTHRDEGG